MSSGNSLITLTFHLLNQFGLVELFQLDMVKLWRFLVMVQEDYHSDNPYHNAVHAADVTQAMYCYLQEPMVRYAERPFDTFWLVDVYLTLNCIYHASFCCPLVVSAACKLPDLLWHFAGTSSSCHSWPGPSWCQPAFPHQDWPLSSYTLQGKSTEHLLVCQNVLIEELKKNVCSCTISPF